MDLIGKQEREKIIELLQYLSIVDIGVVRAYRQSERRADVVSYTMRGGTMMSYRNIEVLTIGGTANGFQHDFVGATCLILVPRSVVVDAGEGTVNTQLQPYDKVGAKCIPLYAGVNKDLMIGFNRLGNFTINTPNYFVNITPHGITYSNADGTVQKSIGGDESSDDVQGAGNIITSTDNDGNYEIRYLRVNDMRVMYRMKFLPDGTYTVQRNAVADMTAQEEGDRDSFIKYVWIDTYAPEGEVTSVLQDSEQNVLRKKVRAVDGTVTDELYNSDGTLLEKTVHNPDNSESNEKYNSDGTLIRKREVLADGSSTEVLNNEDGNSILTCDVAADSTTTITQTDGSDTLNTISLASSGDITIENNGGTTITIGIDGSVSIDTGDATTIHSTGDLTVSTDGKASVSSSGDTEVTASGALMLTGVGATVDAGNGMLTLKNGQSSVFTVLNKLITTLNGGSVATAGSPAAHTVTPGQFTEHMTELQKVMNQ